MNISFEIVTVDDLQFAINPNDIDIVSQTVLSGKPWEPYLLDVFVFCLLRLYLKQKRMMMLKQNLTDNFIFTKL